MSKYSCQNIAAFAASARLGLIRTSAWSFSVTTETISSITSSSSSSCGTGIALSLQMYNVQEPLKKSNNHCVFSILCYIIYL